MTVWSIFIGGSLPVYAAEEGVAAAIAAHCRLPGDPDAFQAALHVEVEKKTGERTRQSLRYEWARSTGADVVGVASLRQGEVTVRLQRRREESSGPLVLDVVPGAMAEWIENLVLFHPSATTAYDFSLESRNHVGNQISFTLGRRGRAGVVNEPFGYALINAVDEADRCRITRAVFAIAPHARALKKVFFQWQDVNGQRLPKRIQVEDTQTLDRYTFAFDDVVLSNAQPAVRVADPEIKKR